MPEKTKKRTGGRGTKLAWGLVEHGGKIDVESLRLKKSDVEFDEDRGEKVRRIEVRVVS